MYIFEFLFIMGNRESLKRSLNVTSLNDNVGPLNDIKLPIIFILGGPGVGKGEPHPVGYSREGETILSRYWLPQGIQCEKIAEKYGFLHISTGDLLRDEIASNSERGVMINRLLSEGNSIPLNLILNLIKEKMQNTLNTTKGFVLDGFPREKIQAKLFEKQIRSPDAVIYLKIDGNMLRERLRSRAVTSGIKGDNDDTITNRIKLFLHKNNVLLKYYDKKLNIIDAERDVDDVFDDVCEVIERKISDKCDTMT